LAVAGFDEVKDNHFIINPIFSTEKLSFQVLQWTMQRMACPDVR